MKKTLLIAAILAVVVAVIFFVLWPRKTREQQVCEKLVTLCGIDAVAPSTCTEGLVKSKRMLGADALTAAEDCVLRAESCAVAATCLADKGLRALAPFVEGLLKQSVGSAKRLAGHLVDRGKEALAEKVKQAKEEVVAAKEKVTAAQQKLRQQIAAEIAAAEAKVEATHADARKWVGETIDSVGQQAKRVGDAVASQVRRGLRILRSEKPDAAAAQPAEEDQLEALEKKLASAKNLIASERYDEARAVLRDLSWPAGAAGGDKARDKQMAAYYRAKREALQQIVDRRQRR